MELVKKIRLGFARKNVFSYFFTISAQQTRIFRVRFQLVTAPIYDPKRHSLKDLPCKIPTSYIFLIIDELERDDDSIRLENKV